MDNLKENIIMEEKDHSWVTTNTRNYSFIQNGKVVFPPQLTEAQAHTLLVIGKYIYGMDDIVTDIDSDIDNESSDIENEDNDNDNNESSDIENEDNDNESSDIENEDNDNDYKSSDNDNKTSDIENGTIKITQNL